MDILKQNAVKNIAAGMEKDVPALQTQGKNQGDVSVVQGSKFITPCSVTSLGGQYTAVVKIKS